MKTLKLLGVVVIAYLTLGYLPLYAEEINVARNKPYTLEALPNSPHGRGGDMNKKLTDGIYSETPPNNVSIWVQDTTVGWYYQIAPTITLDLGENTPIQGVSFSTAAGVADVTWPKNIFLQASTDGIHWYHLGDVRPRADAIASPPEKGRHRFVVNDLNTHARYLRFIVTGKFYIFCDEIEVYRGDESLLQKSLPGIATTLSGSDWAKSEVSRVGIIQRMTKDAAAITKIVEKSESLPNEEKVALTEKLEMLKKEIPQTAMPSLPFKAIMPMNETHAEIFSVYADYLQKTGHQPLSIWKRHRYDLVSLFEEPERGSVELSVDLMKGETRADSFLLTNTQSDIKQATIRLKGIASNGIKLSRSVWTDTIEGEPVADALLEMPLKDGSYTLDLPAGITTKVWVSVDAAQRESGESQGSLQISLGNEIEEIPLRIRVSEIEMKRPRLSFSMWDYTNGQGAWGITPKNLHAAIKTAQDGLVNTPWANPSVLPRPQAEDFDASGNLKRELDFSQLEEWVRRWPEALHYAIFANVPKKFAGAELGSEEFEKRAGVWARTIATKAKSLGIKPGQLILLLLDEPREDIHDEIITGWARIFKREAPEIALMSNPIWADPSKTKNQDAIKLMDILCPNLNSITNAGNSVEKYFQDQRKENNQTLWFYLCSGPVRHFDPSNYYRLMAWKAFNSGATGINFWALGDMGNAPSSWNEYPQPGTSCTPVFIDEDNIGNSIHWQAVQEGVRDYEYLAMLTDALKGKDSSGRELLDKSVSSAVAGYSTNYKWSKPTNRAALDEYRVAILRKLEELGKTADNAQP